MRVFDGSEQPENLLSRHDGLFDWVGQRHGHILRRVFGQILLFPGHTSDCANVGEALANHCSRVSLLRETIEEDLNLKGAQVAQWQISKVRDQIVPELVGVRLFISRIPTALAHRDITLFDKPTERD